MVMVHKRNTYKYQLFRSNQIQLTLYLIARGTSSSNASYWDDPFTFVVWQGTTGSNPGIQWSQDFVPNSYYSNNNPNGFERAHYTTYIT